MPLDVAAQHGHKDTVQELLQLGIEVWGGATLGTDVFMPASLTQRVEVTAMLRDAGAVDMGRLALFTAAYNGCEKAVRFLLQQKWAIHGGTYVDNHNPSGVTAMCLAAGAASPRIVRMLLDAGADETKASRLMYGPQGFEPFTPLGYTVKNLAKEQIQGNLAMEDQLHRLKAIHRLLLLVDAV